MNFVATSFLIEEVCSSITGVYRERLGDQFKDKSAPIINTREELNSVVDPRQVLFPMVFGNKVREFGILCECTWEEEHGLAVKYQNEEVVEVGYQDIII